MSRGPKGSPTLEVSASLMLVIKDFRASLSRLLFYGGPERIQVANICSLSMAQRKRNEDRDSGGIHLQVMKKRLTDFIEYNLEYGAHHR
jgi:hypothetical protein